VQVDPIQPTLKAPGINRLKLKYDEPLSNVALKFNLHRYSVAREKQAANAASRVFVLGRAEQVDPIFTHD